MFVLSGHKQVPAARTLMSDIVLFSRERHVNNVALGGVNVLAVKPVLI